MNLQTELLKIIEDQQKQLELQQKEQAKALQLITTQSMTISELQNFISTLKQHNTSLITTVEKHKSINQRLSEQTISASFSESFQQNLQNQLESRLTELMLNLTLEKDVQQIIKDQLPALMKSELEAQTSELAKQIKQKLDSLISSQEDVQRLIQHLSTKL